MKSTDQPRTGPAANLTIAALVAFAMAAELWDDTIAPTIDGTCARIWLRFYYRKEIR